MKSDPYDNLRVAIRVRPPLNRETQEGVPFRSIAIVSEDHKSISLAEYVGSEFSEIERQRQWIEEPSLFHLHRFTFDSIFDMDSLQEDVYNISAKQAVQSVLEGYNSTIFCYGQTGTGKTYTMEGFTYDSKNPNRGIIQRTIQDIFNFIETTSDENTKFIIRASFLQIYNENISDLLKSDKKNLQIREDKKKGIYVDLLSEWAVRTPLDLYALLRRGSNNRCTSTTYMNDVSSRSHAVFQITVEQMSEDDLNLEKKDNNKMQIKIGKLNLVDLAGSERIRITGNQGKLLEESKKINKSLSCLGNVINALTSEKKVKLKNIPKNNYIPYRDSKLTRLLQDSLGGNCKTTMIATISPSEDAFSESLSTLYFAQRAKKIKNRPVINEDVNNRALIRKYENELKNLRNELEIKNRMINNNGLVMQLKEEKEQALMDKNNAIKELEKASKQFLIEREEKLKLEKKIKMMSEQMIIGGHKIEETPQFQKALKNQLILYENKILEIEKERQLLEEDKDKNKEYEQILIEQKNIMNNLTSKLNLKDEKIAENEQKIKNFEKNEKILYKKIQILEKILTEKKIEFNMDIENLGGNLKKNNNNLTNNFSSSYLPYEVENNYKEFEGRPIIMLSSKEKINELRSIISEQENKIHFLNLVSQKFINMMNHEGKIDLNKLMKQIENSKELYSKIILLQNENKKLKLELNEQKNYINNINMNKSLNNNNNNKNKNLEQFEEFKIGLITMIDKAIRNTEGSPMQSELINIYKYIKNNNKEENKINNNNILNDNKYNYYMNKIEDNKNNNNIISNNKNINLNENDKNMYKCNSIKGISFSPYIQKSLNNNNQNSNNNNNVNTNLQNIQNKINDNLNSLHFNYNDNYNNNINNMQYLSEKNRNSNEQRLKNKKYINKFINSNYNYNSNDD